MFERGALRKIYSQVEEESVWGIRYNYELCDLCKELETPVMMNFARMVWLKHDVKMDEAAVLNDSCVLNPDEQGDQTYDGWVV
jgi:hypothetical protein